MANFEKYLRDIHERTALNRHTLTTNINPEGGLCFTIHPTGTSYDGELPCYSVAGNYVVNIAEAKPAGPLTPIQEVRSIIGQAWEIINKALTDGKKIGPYAKNEFFAAEEERITELIKKANDIMKTIQTQEQ